METMSLKNNKAEKFIDQTAMILGFILVSGVFMGAFANRLPTIITVLPMMFFILVLHIQIGRMAAYLNRSIIIWVGLSCLFFPIATVYAALYKLPLLLRKNVWS